MVFFSIGRANQRAEALHASTQQKKVMNVNNRLFESNAVENICWFDKFELRDQNIF